MFKDTGSILSNICIHIYYVITFIKEQKRLNRLGYDRRNKETYIIFGRWQ